MTPSALRFFGLLVSAGALSACVTSTANVLRYEPFESEAATQAALRAAGPELRLMTWNIGYGGLGASSDFIAEGGKRLRAPSRAAVADNAAGVAATLEAHPADVVLMQELAGPGLLTRNVDVAGAVREAAGEARFYFSPDVRSRIWPGTLSLVHGPAMIVSVDADEPAAVDLPDEPHALAYLIARNYHAMSLDLDVGGAPWTLINVHLAAYETSGTRARQLEAVFGYAERRRKEGRAVVIGGDFNMALRDGWDSDGPPLPREAFPPGWSIVADASRPTVRGKSGPYVEGVSRVSLIDGFIVSPEVRAVSVETLATGFRYADHQPVTAVFVRADGGDPPT
ncbi:MAG: endonuclease/exonuclease/phosphatase family protein [Hyphomonadaceae bacterium]